ncbi:inner membrane protein [Salmonella bongori]|nr:inner membrane protein [Salmonella bongori]
MQLGVEPKIMWAGPNAVIGGLLFGFGIVLAGGCETGWMYRAVEGQVHYWWVGIGNVIGSTILAYSWDDFAPALATSWDKVNLLNTFGPLGRSAGHLPVIIYRTDVNYRLGKTFFPPCGADAC